MVVPNLTADEVQQFCVRYFHENTSENLKVIRYEVTGMSDVPKGYLGKHQFLNVLVERKTPTGYEEDKARFFVKSAPLEIASHMNYVEGFGVFKKELTVYKYVIPRLQDMNIGSEYFAPKCYLAKTNLLVFENLAEQGFRLGTKDGCILDYDHLNCTLKSLANMHAASIVLEQRTNKTVPEMYRSSVEENSYPEDPQHIRSIVFEKAVGALCELVKEIPKYKDSSELKYILEKLPKVFRFIFECCKPSNRWRNTFSHGDLWANNLMFKYNRVGSENVPVECRMVDFQLARYAPPALDVLTVLTIPSTTTFRRQHLTELVDNYYQYFGQYLDKHDINVEEVIPRAEFNETVEYFKLAGLVESCLFCHLTVFPPEYSAELLQNSDNFEEFLTNDRGEVCRKAFLSDKIYRDRMTDMLSALVDSYILKDRCKTEEDSSVESSYL